MRLIVEPYDVLVTFEWQGGHKRTVGIRADFSGDSSGLFSSEDVERLVEHAIATFRAQVDLRGVR